MISRLARPRGRCIEEKSAYSEKIVAKVTAERPSLVRKIRLHPIPGLRPAFRIRAPESSSKELSCRAPLMLFNRAGKYSISCDPMSLVNPTFLHHVVVAVVSFRGGRPWPPWDSPQTQRMLAFRSSSTFEKCSPLARQWMTEVAGSGRTLLGVARQPEF